MTNTFTKGLLLSSVITLLSACNKPQSRPQIDINGKTMGTFYSVKVSGDIAISKEQLQHQIDTLLEQANDDISTYRADSVLSRFNHSRSTNPQAIPRGMANIILMAQRIGQDTGGAMDITIGPLVNLWGFGPDKRPVKVPTQQQIAAAQKKVGLQHLNLFSDSRGEWLQKDLPGMYVDLSTLGEGYGTDELVRLMTRNGITNYLVSVGGAVSAHGVNSQGKPWRVAIQKPTDRENAVQALVDLQGYSISTAGSYRNYFELDGQHYSHIIDPSTGKPIQHRLVSATVIASTALEADGWDTGLMVLDTEKALQLAQEKGLAAYLISKTNDGFSTVMTPQFKAFLVQ
ncbi:FAD:protein FMN transferase ApbE [Serratia symbiotica]|uniref:FAD:protein FMN transferase n=1 Tax=Serratia symbiotica TaxID=138074 RepID=A0A068ZAF5_9GAMM|nr:FAD:protein FMN transferase ApbE [Serratia symbiotica]MBF1995956.1 FAD:protein FMN transferase ApbE [Serratia symbiotica]MBQ0956277.1 FAD:protein FMN transferase ApbE [Serratia symbiotica]QLH62867.1 FAD:protein FMN transferase ApbE [Serratia symbiotica]QTP15445.1 FAD:protein FMN transferase ApbE [Serratia symbiotica]CDS57932.1 putative thiamine biosynthesis lipoprotein; defective assembly or repair of ThiH Fe-S cluster [Serratia symbiotica]